MGNAEEQEDSAEAKSTEPKLTVKQGRVATSRSFKLGTSVPAFTEEGIPHDLKLKINLKLLSWFLEDSLPQYLPDFFGKTPQVIPHQQQGWSNHAFTTMTDQGDNLLIRMKRRPTYCGASDSDWSGYHKEAWIMENINSPVPVSRVLTKGIHHLQTSDGTFEYAFMVQHLLPYQAGDKIIGEEHRLEFLAKVARLCHSVNLSATEGFGRDFDPTTNSFQITNWSEYVEDLIKNCHLQELHEAGTITEEDIIAAEERINSLRNLVVEPRLFHGDIIQNWSNVLIDKDKNIGAFIDWEFAGSGAGLYQELATGIYVSIRDGKSEKQQKAELNAMLRGYQIERQQYRQAFQFDVETFMLIHALGKVQRYNKLRKTGQLQEHPWRMAFAARAESLAKRLIRDW